MNIIAGSSLFASDRKALLILFFLSIIYFLENFDRALISVSPIPYVDYGSYEYSVLVGPAFTIVYTLGGVFFALLSYHDPNCPATKDGAGTWKFNKFAILSLTTLVFSAAFLTTAFALYFWQQVLVRLVMGLSQSIITPFSTSIISDYFPPQMRGAAFGIFNSGTYLSFALTLSLGIYVYVEFGWQAGYIVFGLIGIGFSLIMPTLSYLKVDISSPAAESNVFNAEDPELSTTCAEYKHGVAPSVDIDTKAVIFNHLHSVPAVSTAESNPFLLSASPDSRSRSNYSKNNKKERESNNNNKAGWQTHTEPQTWTAKFTSMGAITYEIVCVRWRNQPGIYLLCLATGIRIGAGYVWSAYTGAFFSDLFETEDGSCSFSYNDQYIGTLPSEVCDSDYPYCVSGTCSALNSFPWHNKGMASINLITFMSWVPIVGSAFGNILGGFVSDYFIGKQTRTEKSLRQSADVAVSPLIAPLTTAEALHGATINRTGGHGHIDEANTSTHRSTDHGEFMVSSESAVDSSPLMASVHGDNSEEGDNSTDTTPAVDQSLRMWIAGWSNILPVPLIVGAFLLEFPYCFLIMICSGMMGEMYMGQALATITDQSLTPAHHVTPAVALFMFVITIIGGNMPLLVPLVNSWVGYGGKVDISFNAAPVYTDATQDTSDVEFVVQNDDARQMQFGLLYVLLTCYGVSGILYLISYHQMRSYATAKKTKLCEPV